MKTITLCFLGLALAGCQSEPRKAAVVERARFFLESADDQGEVVTLPLSGSRITVIPKAVFTEYDIVNVEIARVELGPCLVFKFTPAAAHDLKSLSAAHLGRRLVLTLSGVPFGARRMSHPMDRGELFIYVEVPDAALPALADSLNETSAALRAGAK